MNIVTDKSNSQLKITHTSGLTGLSWQGPPDSLAFELEEIRAGLLDIEKQLFIIARDDQPGLTSQGIPTLPNNGDTGTFQLLGIIPPTLPETLGDPGFRAHYGCRYAYYTGAMANAISSTRLVITLGKAGILSAFGAAGVVPARLEVAIQEIKDALPESPYAFNLINSPNEPSMERRAAELYVQHGVTTVEASAYLDLTLPLVHYRVAGLATTPDGNIIARNRLIAKLSRKEVARLFMLPAPAEILDQLLSEGKITPQQAELSQHIPMADDITVEADSGGHTDNRPLVCLLPSILALRDEIQATHHYPTPIRVGAAGGISTPASAYAAFAMGAAFVVTGSVNQACVEAGASEHTRNLLAQAEMADVIMAPAADMFEMGVKVQVLKRGTMFAMRGLKLYEYYNRYPSLEAIPAEDRDKLERTVFKRKIDEIWADTQAFFNERDPRQIERAENDPRQKMALVFRWYLGLSSRWSNSGEKGREMDYQVWCGPSMGAFNEWVRGTYLAEPANRRAVDIALHILTGAAYLSRLRYLNAVGVHTPNQLACYTPHKPLG
jgi:trans-AT polyketide synthase, acyltransferase and oxidoreductase domains